MKIEIIDNEANEAYHLKHDFISSSQLKLMGKSPLHFSLYHSLQKEPTDAMIVGTATHTAVFEPENFTSQYAVMREKIDRRTKAGKEAWDKFYVENMGKIVLSAEMYEKVQQMTFSVMTNAVIKRLFTPGSYVVEQSMYWQDDITGIKLRCRPDFRRKATVLDLKTTTDASPDKFFSTMANFDYPLSAALYTEGCSECLGFPIKFFLFCAVESEPPYACMVYRITEDDLANARFRMREYLTKIMECRKAGDWPGYESLPAANEGIIDVVLPRWAK